jgi:hypothetical protein
MQHLTDLDNAANTEILNICAGRTPTAIVREAQIKLETVVRLYYARHSFDHYDPWIAFALTIIGNMVIKDLSTVTDGDQSTRDGYRSTLILSARGLTKQSPNYHIGALLALQLEGSMHPDDLQLGQMNTTNARLTSQDQALIAAHSQSLWPLPGISRIDENPDKTRLNKLLSAITKAKTQSNDTPRPEETAPVEESAPDHTRATFSSASATFYEEPPNQ